MGFINQNSQRKEKPPPSIQTTIRSESIESSFSISDEPNPSKDRKIELAFQFEGGSSDLSPSVLSNFENVSENI
tara:strand:- start:255 stop:476 length:222 start_codon:yes stop_codon:yes gene_type:complete